MNPFLDDFFNSLNKRSNERAAFVLQEATVSKDVVPEIADKLSQISGFAPLFVATENDFDLIRSAGFFGNLRDAHIRVQEIYSVANLVSLLLDSHHAILLSEAKALEDELVALEKLAQNYSFLLSDNGAFDFAYLETFSDEFGRDITLQSAPDRSSMSFGPVEAASVNTAEGTLVLPQNLTVSYGLNASIVDGNITANLTNTNVSAITASANTGWRASLDAVGPITSGLAIAQGNVGAQVVIEFRLSDPAPCSEIKVTPFADAVQELIQVIAYPSDDESGAIRLMDSPVELDRQYTLHFPMRTVKRFKMVINQPMYTRISQLNTVEDQYRQAYDQLQSRLAEIRDTYDVSRAPTFQRLLQTVSFLNKDRPIAWDAKIAPAQLSNSLILGVGSVGPVNRNNLRDLVSRSWRRGPWLNGKYNQNFDMSAVLLRVFKSQSDLYTQLSRREVEKFDDWLSTKGLNDPDGVITTPLAQQYNEAMVYRYTFGISSVSIGVESVGFKGYWISAPFEADGDFGEVRIKAAAQDYRKPLTDLDNNVLTSIEYSVSNKSTPDKEDDWIPIMPIAQNIIEGERLFPDATGKCRFRFSATQNAEVVVYKNGYAIPLIPAQNFLYDARRQGITGVNLPVQMYTTEDILTARYTPVGDNTTINFEAEGFNDAPLITVYDEDGAGERFDTTVGRNEITLRHLPYLDQSSIETATYVDGFGLTPYQPITVRLADGSLATNLTNYKEGTQATLPADGYYYLHSDKTLIFNQPIVGPFRVYYQYLQNNVRVRVVLRCNSREFVSPKVDYYQIKAKTRRPVKEKLS